MILNEVPDATFWIVGRGSDEYTTQLKYLATSLGVYSHIVFHGFVSEKEKFTLMSKAHILIAPFMLLISNSLRARTSTNTTRSPLVISVYSSSAESCPT